MGGHNETTSIITSFTPVKFSCPESWIQPVLCFLASEYNEAKQEQQLRMLTDRKFKHEKGQEVGNGQWKSGRITD